MSPSFFSEKLVGASEKMIKLAREWLDFCKFRYSASTYRGYRSVILSFLDSLPAGIEPGDIRASHIEYFLQLTASNYSPETGNTYTNVIRSFYKWASSYHGMENVTLPVTMLRETKRHIRILSDTEYKKVLSVTTGIDRQAIQFLANTGLRRAEFRQLRWSDFDKDYVRILGKGSKKRLVPLNDVCKSIIGTPNGDVIPPFVKPFQERYHAIYQLCDRASKRAGVDYFVPHSLRHYFATRLINAGVPLKKVSFILGHSSVKITEDIYVHLTADDLVDVTDVLDY